MVQCVAACCSVLQYVAVRCSTMQYVAVHHSALQYIAVRCSALQCVAERCSTLPGGVVFQRDALTREIRGQSFRAHNPWDSWADCHRQIGSSERDCTRHHFSKLVLESLYSVNTVASGLLRISDSWADCHRQIGTPEKGCTGYHFSKSILQPLYSVCLVASGLLRFSDFWADCPHSDIVAAVYYSSFTWCI